VDFLQNAVAFTAGDRVFLAVLSHPAIAQTIEVTALQNQTPTDLAQSLTATPHASWYVPTPLLIQSFPVQ
jgi:hypothetical protein